jgi:hypothetical protein
MASARTVVARQSLVAALLVLAFGAWAIGEPVFAPAALSAAVVLAALVVLAVILRWVEGRRAIELIIAGRERSDLAAVRRELRRLSSARTQSAIARAYARVLDQGAGRSPARRSIATIADARISAAVTPEVRLVVARLLRGDANPRGVALAERLLADGLWLRFGGDEIAVRAELRRALAVMDQPVPGRG